MNDWPICCGHDSILELLVIGRKRVGSTKVEQKENLNNELTRNSSIKKRERKDRDLCYIRRRMTHTGPDRTDAAEYKKKKKYLGQIKRISCLRKFFPLQSPFQFGFIVRRNKPIQG